MSVRPPGSSDRVRRPRRLPIDPIGTTVPTIPKVPNRSLTTRAHPANPDGRLSCVCQTHAVLGPVQLVVSDLPEVVADRLREAVVEPLGTAIDDGMSLHFTAKLGEPPLVGRVDGSTIAVWRRGSGNWVGLNRFEGQVGGTGTGASVAGRIRLRWNARVSIALFFVMVPVMLALTGALIGWHPLVPMGFFYFLGGAWSIAIQRRDRRLLLDVLREVTAAESVVR